MKGLGNRLRLRAQALGLSDTEVARRTGLSVPRYGNYVRDAHEPDLDTLVNIAKVLGVTLDSLVLGDADERGADAARVDLETRLLTAARALELADLKMAVGQVELIVRHRRADQSPD